MSDQDESAGGGGGGGGGAKAGMAIGLVAVLGLAGRLVDDCGKVAVRGAAHGDEVARGAAHAGDDLARGSKPGAELFGVGLGDGLARGARPAALGGEALGEGALVRVLDDAAPGAGTSVEEALRDAGLELALELLPIEDAQGTADGGADGDADGGAEGDARAMAMASAPGASAASIASAASPVLVLVPATWSGARKGFETQVGAGSIVALVGAVDARGTFAFGDERIDDRALHARCLFAKARCVVLTCPEADTTGCAALAAGMSRQAAAGVPEDAPMSTRALLLTSALIRSRAALRAGMIGISRVDADDGVVVRSRLGR